MREPYGDVLRIDQLLTLAKVVAGSLRLRIPDSEVLRQKISKREPTPMYLENRDYCLWIDRFYIAAEDLDAERVWYLYLTRKHIVEEHSADLKANRNQRKGVLDEATRAQFAVAWATMNLLGIGYAVRRLNPAVGQPRPFDFEAPWWSG